MNKLLLGVVIALFAVVGAANAQQANSGVGIYDGAGPYTRMAGKRAVITSSQTNNTFNWQFWSRAVRVCIQNQNITAGQAGTVNAVWFRMGSTLSDSPSVGAADTSGMTIVATSDSLFEGGNANQVGIGLPAPAISASASDGTNCVTMPIRSRGLILHSTVASTTDIMVFGGQPTPTRP